jgi:hypothetical protein
MIWYAILWGFWIKSPSWKDRLLSITLAGAFMVQLVLSLHFYPRLLSYQATSEAGKMIGKKNPDCVFSHGHTGPALDYYGNRVVQALDPNNPAALQPGCWVYVSAEKLSELPDYKIIQEFNHFHVTQINMAFVNPATRKDRLRKMYLVEITEDGFAPTGQ